MTKLSRDSPNTRAQRLRHADDLERPAVDVDLLAHRIHVREELLFQVVADERRPDRRLIVVVSR